ncbi:MAG TPA: DUF5107 domain-containing protein [Hanamia sp.]
MRVVFFKRVIAFVLLILPSVGSAQNNASIKEFVKNYITYPFSDPDPVPNMGKIYPYFRYDGFSFQSMQKAWKVVELENDFIKVQIMPQIGGKIWTAIDKTNGKSFIFNNEVVKFRDIAMRGPFTSGGLEANFGIIGHTPTVSTPVDYLTQKNEDGSVSCIIGALDLLTRTRWTIEIRLPKDKAYFITHTYWHNPTSISQPYYSWMNMGIKTRDSLEFIEPGTHSIGHDGSVRAWPFDSVEHKNLSIYGQNNFGPAKSTHILGIYSKYFGAYWQKEDFGVIHYAERDNKLGKKLYLMALSGEGDMREQQETDHSGRYAEIQSGRLFNQNQINSSLTPFKQVGFTPYQTDSWTEYWYPFTNTKGVTNADLNGVVNLIQNGDSIAIFISPVSKIFDTLRLYDKTNHLIYQEMVDLQPLQPYHKILNLNGKNIGRLSLHGTIIKINQDKEKQLDRPLEPWPDFDWNSAYGLYLMGRDEARYRNFPLAEDKIRQSLEKDAAFMPALTEMAFLQYQKMHYDSTYYYARKALSIDTYNPEANYYYGLAADKLGKFYDALDGFEVACLTSPFRSAAYTEMSRMYLKNKDYSKAYEYASKGLDNNSRNITALQLQYLASRLMGKIQDEERIKQEILQIDPLNHFIQFEKFWTNKDNDSKQAFTSAIRNELPQETYLELAIWYYGADRLDECETILNAAPKNNEIAYWEAYLHKDKVDASKWLDAANKGTAMMIFPFREETASVMEWARSQTTNWKPTYYLALIESFKNNKKVAKDLMEGVSENVDFAPFYVIRAMLYDSLEKDKKLSDLSKAVNLNKDEWRYRKYLASCFLEYKENAKAVQTLEPYFKTHPNNYIIGILYSRCLMLNDQYSESENILSNIQSLPGEGNKTARELYNQTKLMLALESLKKHNYKTALQKVEEAGEWPKNLGVGKPYSNLINTEMEDSLRILITAAMKNKNQPIDYEKYALKIKSISRNSEFL